MVKSRILGLTATTSLLGLIVAFAVPAAAVAAGHRHVAPAHQPQRGAYRGVGHPPRTTPQRGGGALQNPLLGHQGTRLPTLRPSSALTSIADIGPNLDDPILTGCWNANAYIAATAPLPASGTPIGYVANWYSPDCGTNWAETVVYNDPGFRSEIYNARITDMTTGEQHSWLEGTGANGTYTDMTQSATTTACADGDFIVNGVDNATGAFAACA